MPRTSLLLLAALLIFALAPFGCKRAPQESDVPASPPAALAGDGSGAARAGLSGDTLTLQVKLAKGWQEAHTPKAHPSNGQGGCPVSQVSEMLGIELSSSHGCVIGALKPGGPAAQAGLKVGDSIVGCNGGKVECPSTLDPLLWITQNDTVKLQVVRPKAAAAPTSK